MTDRWPPPVSERKEGERPLLGSAGLSRCGAVRPTRPQARRKAGRPERAVGHQAEGKLFLLFFIFLSFLCLLVFKNISNKIF
jgi:hypothetical protein